MNNKYYGVVHGRKKGIFTSIDQVKEAIENMPGSVFFCCPNLKQAESIISPSTDLPAGKPLPMVGASKAYIYGTVGKFVITVINPNGETREIIQEGKILTTPERSLIYAACVALMEINGDIQFYTTSIYVNGCLTGWLNKWEKDNWNDVANLDLLKPLYDLMKNRKIVSNIITEDNRYITQMKNKI